MTDWAQAAANAARTAFQSAESIVPPMVFAWKYRLHTAYNVRDEVALSVQPVVSSSHVLVPTIAGNLHSFVAGIAGGTKEWSTSIGAPILPSVAADGTNAYVAE